MNVIDKCTIQNLKLNKKRTIVTIIGIILSTALVCGVVGLVTSFQQSFVNMVLEGEGEYHITFKDVPSDELKYIENNPKVGSYFLTEHIGWANLKESRNDNKPYVSIMEYDYNALKKYGIKLIDGRLPLNSSEVLIPEHINSNGRVGYKIGDTLTFDVGTRKLSDGSILTREDSLYLYNEKYDEEYFEENIVDTTKKTYTVVGIMDRPQYSVEGYSSPGYTLISHLDNVKDSANISVYCTNPTDYGDVYKTVVGNDENPKYDTHINKELLRYQGAISETTMRLLYGIASVVMVIIVVSSVFVIRNSFTISVAEKTKQYGMLSSVGATRKQIRKSVIREGTIIGLIGIPLGILSGIIGIVVLLKVVNMLLADALMGMEFVYKISPIAILITIVVSYIIIYLSCIIPAHKASKISPIEAIRGNNDIKIKSKKIKTSKLTKKIFGIGGVIASKNLKRSKKKYRTTILSIVISIVIFVSLSSFLHYGNVSSGLYYTEMKFNINVNESNEDVELYKKIAKKDNVDNYAYYYYSSGKVDMEKYCTTPERYENNFYISIYAYNNEYFKQYIKSLGINENNYKDTAILIDEKIRYDGEVKHLENIYKLQSGDEMEFAINGDTDNMKKVKISKRTTERPMGLEGTYGMAGMLIVSEDFKKDSDMYGLSGMFIDSSNATTLENTLNDLQKTDIEFAGITTTNLDKMVDMQNRMVLVIAIFLYGFITIITLIGVTNIFNTITTNMILRSKEFAMLKSIGMTNREFNKMIRLESLLYGIKSLLIGIPIGILGSYAIYKSFAESIDSGYEFPIQAIIISIIFVFLIVWLTMKYSLKKINKQNIIETIRNDNI